VSELIREGVDGFVVPPDDYDSLAERIEFLLDRPKLIREMGARGREAAQAEFDVRINTSKLVTVLKGMAVR
jgi:glycosyltransferase involved in cell wall biosynthesis